MKTTNSVFTSGVKEITTEPALLDTIGVLQHVVCPPTKVLLPILLDEKSALIVIRSILNNFQVYIKTMYLDYVHGYGRLSKTDLDKLNWKMNMMFKECYIHY